MDKKILNVIKEEAALRYPNEACGVIVKDGKKARAIPCRNVSKEPRTRFLIDPEQHSQIADKAEILSIWHTHVNCYPRPSDIDKAGCELHGIPWHIVSIYKTDAGFEFSEPTTIEPCGYEAPYLERPYVYGIYDCYSLVRDFYKREFGIVLGDYGRVEEFWKKGYNAFMDNYEKEGFVVVPFDAGAQRGDLMIIQIDGDIPNHIVIYEGDEVILHHCEGRLSTRHIYGGFWAKHTIAHIRHKDLMKC